MDGLDRVYGWFVMRMKWDGSQSAIMRIKQRIAGTNFLKVRPHHVEALMGMAEQYEYNRVTQSFFQPVALRVDYGNSVYVCFSVDVVAFLKAGGFFAFSTSGGARIDRSEMSIPPKLLLESIQIHEVVEQCKSLEE